jgi:hypothetical protein
LELELGDMMVKDRVGDTFCDYGHSIMTMEGLTVATYNLEVIDALAAIKYIVEPTDGVLHEDRIGTIKPCEVTLVGALHKDLGLGGNGGATHLEEVLQPYHILELNRDMGYRTLTMGDAIDTLLKCVIEREFGGAGTCAGVDIVKMYDLLELTSAIEVGIEGDVIVLPSTLRSTIILLGYQCILPDTIFEVHEDMGVKRLEVFLVVTEDTLERIDIKNLVGALVEGADDTAHIDTTIHRVEVHGARDTGRHLLGTSILLSDTDGEMEIGDADEVNRDALELTIL